MADDSASTPDIAKILSELNALIVDDERFDRDLMAAVLEKIGISRIEIVDSGAAAAQKIEAMLNLQVRFDLIFLDWKMPVRDGQSTLRMMRRQFKLFDAHVFVTTASSSEELVKGFIKDGANDFIVKPVTLDVVRPKIERYATKKIAKRSAA